MMMIMLIMICDDYDGGEDASEDAYATYHTWYADERGLTLSVSLLPTLR